MPDLRESDLFHAGAVVGGTRMTAESETVLRAACWFAGAEYGGVQEVHAFLPGVGHTLRRWLVITEPETRSTGYVPIDEQFTTSAVLAKAMEIRRRYQQAERRSE